MDEGGTHRVVADHRASYPYSVELKEGDRVIITDRREDGWIWCFDEGGRGVWVPVRYLELLGDLGVLLFDYDSRELNVSVGEALTLLKEESSWMWCKRQDGNTGWVPSGKVEKL